MRLVEVMLLADEARTELLDVLDAEQLDYSIVDMTDDPTRSAMISFPVAAHAVESIQDQIADLDCRDEMYTVVYDPETIVSDRLDDDVEEDPQVGALAPGRISRRELHSKAADLLPDFVIYTILTAISAVVATAGVLLNSLSVLIGSMVIAPLLGPALSTAVATVIDDQRLFGRSVLFQLKGSVVALVSSVVFAYTAKSATYVSRNADIDVLLQLSTHTSPAFLLVAVAVCGGIAGAISLSTSGSTELVGVMVAAAIMPPIGIVGVGIAWGRPRVVLGSTAVVLINLMSINLAAIVSLWYLGYKPDSWQELKQTRSKLLRRSAVLLGLVLTLTVFLTRLSHGDLNGVIPAYVAW